MSGFLFVIFAPGPAKMISLISSKHSNDSHDNSSFLFIYLLIFVVFPVCLALYHVKMTLIQLEPLQRGPRASQYLQQLFTGRLLYPGLTV